MNDGPVKIGWSSQDVTPDKPVNLMGQFHVRVSERVNDPVTVTALALESPRSGERLVMVSCDVTLLPPAIAIQACREVRMAVPELDPRSVVFCATHTHSAPALLDHGYPRLGPEVMTPAAYSEFFCRRAAQAVKDAWRGRRPAGVSWGFGRAVVGHNRRMAYLDGSSAMYGSMTRADFAGAEGGEDSAVDLLFTWNAKRALTGVVVNLACPAQVSEMSHFITADFWHEARVEIRRRLGRELFVLPLCGAAGDQAPAVLLHQRAERLMQSRRGTTNWADWCMELRRQIGERIGQAVESAYALARQDVRTDLPFRHVHTTLRLPSNGITRRAYLAAVREHKRLLADRSLDGLPPTDRKASSRLSAIHYQKSLMDRYGDRRKYGHVDVHAGRIGDVAFATNPFELFLDHGLRMKERSPAVQTFVVQLAAPCLVRAAQADGYLAGYLPTERSVARGDYGASALDCPVGPAGGQMLVEKTLRLITRLW
jgi:hypothetical protein